MNNTQLHIHKAGEEPGFIFLPETAIISVFARIIKLFGENQRTVSHIIVCAVALLCPILYNRDKLKTAVRHAVGCFEKIQQEGGVRL